MNTINTRRETADSDRGATYSGLAASAQRSLYALEATARDLGLARRSGEPMTAADLEALRTMPSRIAEQRAAVAELQRRASTRS